MYKDEKACNLLEAILKKLIQADGNLINIVEEREVILTLQIGLNKYKKWAVEKYYLHQLIMKGPNSASTLN